MVVGVYLAKHRTIGWVLNVLGLQGAMSVSDSTCFGLFAPFRILRLSFCVPSSSPALVL